MDFSIKYKKIKLGSRLKKLKHVVLSLQTTSKSRRTVSFVPPSENDICEVPHIDDYSSELIGSIWYSDADYRRIQTSCAKIIRKMNSDKPIKKMKNKYCPRGLEKYPDAVASSRQIIRKKSIDAVLDEQVLQARDNVFEPADIADIYAEHCLVSKIDAITAARTDELESNHVMRCTKKIDAKIKNSQEDKLTVHYRAPLLTELKINKKTSPQA
jgi:hypothetical protein